MTTKKKSTKKYKTKVKKSSKDSLSSKDPSLQKKTAIFSIDKTQYIGEFRLSKNGEAQVLVKEKKNTFHIFVPPSKTEGAKNGQTVLVALTPSASKQSNSHSGKVLKIFPDRGEFETEFSITIARHGLLTSFSEAANQEAESFPDKIPSSELEKRKDLRDLPLVTIDGEDARDFDDAIFVEKQKEGFRLIVAIADVSHFVRLGGVLDREAYERATSVYFPGSCFPMLPERLSNGLCSLMPHQDRLAFACEMTFDSHGKKEKSVFYKAIIKSAARLTYPWVEEAFIEKKSEARAQHPSLIPVLEKAWELYALLKKERIQRGGLDFDLPEPKIYIDPSTGQMTAIQRTKRLSSHMLIEEFMIAANEAAAERMAHQELPMIYRIHPPPSLEKMLIFRNLAHGFGHALPHPDQIKPYHLARVIEYVRGKPHEKMMNTALLRSLSQAIYAFENCGHFGLALENYTHFTSPIRRYPDLIVHRLLAENLQISHQANKKPKWSVEQLNEMAIHCSKKERRAMEAEWEMRDLYKAFFMKNKVGEQFHGIISGVVEFGFFVEVEEHFVEGLVHIRSLPKNGYSYDEKLYELWGKNPKTCFRIGDRVLIKLSRVDVTKRQVDFDFVEKISTTK